MVYAKIIAGRKFRKTEKGIFVSRLGPTLYVCFLWTTTENGLEKLCRHQQGSGLHNFICLWPALPRLRTMKETPRWRKTATSSLNEISTENKVLAGEGGYFARPHPFRRQIIKDDVDGFSTTSDICFMLQTLFLSCFNLFGELRVVRKKIEHFYRIFSFCCSFLTPLSWRNSCCFCLLLFILLPFDKNCWCRFNIMSISFIFYAFLRFSLKYSTRTLHTD